MTNLYTEHLRHHEPRPASPTRTVNSQTTTLLLLISAFNDLPRSIVFGPTNLVVILTIFTVILTFFLTILHGRIAKEGLSPLFFYMIFCLYIILYLLYSPKTLQAFQNTAMYLLFGGVALISFQAATSSSAFAEVVLSGIKRMAWISAALYVSMSAIGQAGFDGIFSPRSYALLALAGVAVYVAEARAGRPFSGLKAALFCLLCLTTVSRTASAMAMIILAATWLNIRHFKSWIATLILASFSVFIYIYIALNIPEFRHSFIGGDKAIQFGSLSIDTKGRLFWWSVLWDSFLNSPIIGHGPGSSESVLYLGNQPHNDHLRLLHDFGLIGYALWWLAMGRSLFLIIRGWRLTASLSYAESSLLMTACLYACAFIVVMITDNILIYYPPVVVLAVLIGSSLALSGRNIRFRKKFSEEAQRTE